MTQLKFNSGSMKNRHALRSKNNYSYGMHQPTDATDGEAVRFRLAWSEVVSRLSPLLISRHGEALLSTFSHVKIDDQDLPDVDASEIKPADRPWLLRELAVACRKGIGRTKATNLEKTIRWLSELVRFDETDAAIVCLFARVSLFEEWQELADALPGHRGNHLAPASIAPIIGLRAFDVEQRLVASSPICRAGLVERDPDGEYSASNFLLRVSRSGARTKKQLQRTLMPKASASSLAWDDFNHLGMPREIAERLVASGAGSSILLYGPPGTGKTEFAKIIAQRTRLTAVFAGEADDEGREPRRHERLAHLMALRALTRGPGKHVIVMDEADDVLTLDREDRGHRSKLWLNNLVEHCDTPTIWILNQPRSLEESLVRRMDLAIEFSLPSMEVREKVIRRHMRKERLGLSDQAVVTLANLGAPPAILSSAIRGAKRAGGGEREAIVIGEELAFVISGRRPAHCQIRAEYDASLSTANTDLAALAKQLVEAPSNRWSLLLSGPSGTGKTAFARYLAAAIGIELIEKRGSDLLDPFVGGTEQAIAEAFHSAARRGALLLIDEADDFLSDRTDAQRSWERTMVNGMLRQMEALKSPFIATTNYAELLDPASQRRFTIRVSFQELSADHAGDLFTRYFRLSLPADCQPLDGQTPGDFAVVAERARLLGITDTQTLVRWLRDEAEARGNRRGPIGF
ncbi:AAA family ATPase [Parasphingorhabdus sp.]|uniref:AAA family ATPase n=1 Tax=Parasphingorhabdus sp. TaxID=2709688 RepID=UPI00300331E0